ncbi:hypothetical protein [Miltoncostaea marina]|uniref:hypothetical protein n=1 Tax=Miltoncostaea marina TaxID=2843215 RepID=UPI001C3DCBC7|nr:hypothetical protein [Miltoncostaea marina]
MSDDRRETGPAGPPPALAEARCADCGRPIARRADGRWAHRARGVVAACDLDADHPAVPEGAPPPQGA